MEPPKFVMKQQIEQYGNDVALSSSQGNCFWSFFLFFKKNFFSFRRCYNWSVGRRDCVKNSGLR